jgi:hypothetical protein
MLELTANNFTQNFDIDLNTLDPMYRQAMIPMLVYFKQVNCGACKKFDPYYMELDRTKVTMFPRLILTLAYVTPDIVRKSTSKGPEFLKHTPTIMFFIGGSLICKIEYPMVSSDFGTTTYQKILKFLEDYKSSYPEIFGVVNNAYQQQYTEPYGNTPRNYNTMGDYNSNNHLGTPGNNFGYNYTQTPPTMPMDMMGNQYPLKPNHTVNTGMTFFKKGGQNSNLFSSEHDERLLEVDWPKIGLAPKDKPWNKDTWTLQKKFLYS